jgi:N6-adenosine-specific RNA methylase IME4
VTKDLTLTGVEMTPTGLTFDRDLTQDEWEQMGEVLGRWNQGIQWYIGDWLCHAKGEWGVMYEDACERFGIEYQTAANFKHVADSIQFYLRREKLTFSHHKLVAGMSPTQQKRILAKAEKGGWTVAEMRRQMKQDQKLAADATPIAGEYEVIVIDPPWDMDKILRDVRPRQVEFDYPTMSEEQLASHPIPAADDCHLWCWTTHKFMPMAMRLVEVWGFRYVCQFVWHKPGGFQPVGLPQYNCEFAVYARKGAPSFVDTTKFSTCFEAARGAHSEKPEAFYEMVRRVTDGRRCDMFNRRKIEGFDGLGNEAPE